MEACTYSQVLREEVSVKKRIVLPDHTLDMVWLGRESIMSGVSFFRREHTLLGYWSRMETIRLFLRNWLIWDINDPRMTNLGSLQETWRVENVRGKERHTWGIKRETDRFANEIEQEEHLIYVSLSIGDQRGNHGPFSKLYYSSCSSHGKGEIRPIPHAI